MTTPVTKPPGDAAVPPSTANTTTTTTTFSYAQAAKGRSTSAPRNLSSTKTTGPASSAVSEPVSTSAPPAARSVSGEPQATSNERHVNERPKASSAIGLDASPSAGATEASTVKTVPASSGQAPAVPTKPSSAPSSPSFGASSTSTLMKEDDLSATPNASSESTWDKQSQTSTGLERGADAVTASKETSNAAPADEKDTPRPLTAAPLPAVNIWQQRKEAQEAKAKASQTALPVLPAVPRPPNVAMPAPQTGDKKSEATKADARKKGRIPGVGPTGLAEDGEQPAVQSSASITTKEKKKPLEPSRVPREDGPKKPAPRPRALPDRTNQKDGPVPMGPPPVQDPTSWPTPDTAQDEEKKKAQEKGDRPDKDKGTSASSKPHGKEKWTPVPYTPSVIFETQISTSKRGGRPGRGGREGIARGGGHQLNGQVTGERAPFVAGLGLSTPDTSDRGRPETVSQRGGYGASKQQKRASSAGTTVSRDQRRIGSGAAVSGREHDHANMKAGDLTVATPISAGPGSGNRRTSTATQTDGPMRSKADTKPQHVRSDPAAASGPTHAGAARSDRSLLPDGEHHGQARSAGVDRRADGPMRPSDFFRDGHHPGGRDRNDGRADRGRGNFRTGRGGNNAYGNTSAHSTHPANVGPPTNGGTPASYGFGKGAAYNGSQSLPSHQHSASSTHYAAAPHTRNYRGNSRAQTLPNTPLLGRISGGAGSGPAMPPIQTQFPPVYEYPAMHTMSAVPYSAFNEHVATLNMVALQLDYYFSVDNLCKDLFLRKHMDSQGFVFIGVIAEFNRIRQLTQDMELVRYACLHARKVELRTGSDGLDRLRPRDGWSQWVLNMEERDPSVQNDGPSQLQQPYLPFPSEFDGPFMVPPFGHGSPMDAAFDRNAPEPMYVPMSGMATPYLAAPSPTGAPNMSAPANGDGRTSQTPLSAVVPNFSPMPAIVNGSTSSVAADKAAGEDVFSNAEVDNLVIVMRQQSSGQTEATFQHPGGRTYSNGSIDERTIAEAIGERHSPPVVNGAGHGQADGADGGSTATSSGPGAASGAAASAQAMSWRDENAPAVFWMKGCDSPIGSLPHDISHETYDRFRRDALKQRETAHVGTCHRDMDNLYQFWSHFLVRNFNNRMYDEFHDFALDDLARRSSDAGVRYLVQYYDVLLQGQKVMPDKLLQHYLELVDAEDRHHEDRQAFEKLKAAWMNGDLATKNRKKLETLVGANLRTELERSST